MFAARKEFELLKLLATDRVALATARRLGAVRPQAQPQSPAVAAGRDAAAPPPNVAAAPAAPKAVLNARRRRGAARSARYHAAKRHAMRMRSMVLVTIFIVRLRRLRDGTLGAAISDAGSLSSADSAEVDGLTKRRPSERPSSSSSHSSTRSTRSLLARGARGGEEKRRKGGLVSGFLLQQAVEASDAMPPPALLACGRTVSDAEVCAAVGAL